MDERRARSEAVSNKFRWARIACCNPVGVGDFFDAFSQGSSFVATLG